MEWRAPSTSERTFEETVWSWLTVFMDDGPRLCGAASLLQHAPKRSTFHGVREERGKQRLETTGVSFQGSE